MAYLSPSFLRRFDESVASNSRYLSEAKTASATARIFLSHSSADDEYVNRVVLFFRDFNAVVYADNFDRSLPRPPNVATASRLKTMISNSHRFVVLVSPNSKTSRWIPWELGLADGYNGVAPIAILPITDDGTEDSWTIEEYFGLYPRIKRRNDDSWVVHDPRDDKWWTLNQWLDSSVS